MKALEHIHTPELKLIVETLIENAYKFDDYILDEEHKKSIKETKKLIIEDTNKVTAVLIQLLKRKNLIDNGMPQQKFVDVLFAAAALHKLYLIESMPITSLFSLREEYNLTKEKIANDDNQTDLNQAFTMVDDLMEAVCQTVEAQFGDETPVPMCKPTVNSPTEMFANAVWIAKNFTPQA